MTALVFNFIDQLTHGRTENSTLFEVARDTSALRSLTRTWFERSPLWDALREAERRERAGAAHHRSRLDPLPHPGHGLRQARHHRRTCATSSARTCGRRTPTPRSSSTTSPSFGLPPRTPGTRLLLATGDRFFVYPTKLREYQARYRGAFLHGGVSPEEVVLPIALLTPRRG